MRQKKILLIYPYFNTGMVKDQLFPPLGISILSGLLKQHKIDVMNLDCTFLTFDEAINKAEDYKPDITGIYVMTTLARKAVELLKALRIINPDSHYVTGGPLPSLYPEKFAREFDHVFVGEAAKSFPSFWRDYFEASDSRDFLKNLQSDQYPGLFSKTMDLEALNPGFLTKEEIDACPKPDRSGFNHKKYQKMCHQATGHKRASIMMTYGCQFSCDFCSKPIFGNKVRFRDLDKIFEEIEDIRSYGYDTLWIADDLFTYDPGFLKRFCQRLIDKKWNLNWSCLSRVDGITDEMVSLMKKSGCYKAYLGIESGNNRILELMNKKTTVDGIRKGVDVFKRNGVNCAGFFIVGYPGETIQTIEETLAFSLSLDLEESSFNVPYPLPGSKLYQRVAGISDDDWTIENETRFLYQSEFDADWLKKRIKETQEAMGRSV